jgi:replicative DNA helicase
MTNHMTDHLEAAVLAAALIDVPAWHVVTTSLAAIDFTDPDHRTIFAALRTVTPVGRTPDVLQVVAALKRAGHAELQDRVSFLLDAIPTVDPLPNWIAGLRSASRTRQTVTALTQAVAELETGTSPDDVERALDRTFMAIRASVAETRVFDDRRVMAAAALDYLDNDGRTGTPYGFAPWDGAVLPALQGHLVLLGGASGAGKSCVARNVLRQWVQRSSRRVGWLTCEMTGEEQLVHLACIDAGVAIEDYYRRRLSADDRERFARELAWWRDTDLLRVNELGAVTPDTALRIFRRWREEGVTHFLLDHLHRLDYGANKSGDDLRIPVASFARALKTFAKDSESVVLALVQYSKIKPHEEPSDDKIREANNILEEADAVFHIYRPLVACERDTTGALYPLTKPDTGLPYFESEAPKGTTLGHDSSAVYAKLGKQRRRLRDGLIRVPFNHRLAVLYDTTRPDIRRIA